jgi:hypothetical protein
VERAGGEGQSDHTVSVERLQGLNSWPAAASSGMRHGYSRYVNQKASVTKGSVSVGIAEKCMCAIIMHYYDIGFILCKCT